MVKYTIADGALNDNVSLYVFAAGDDFSSEPATPTLGPLSTLDATADIVPTGIALRQFEAAQRITVDGIRVKTSWALNTDIGPNALQVNGNEKFGFYPNPVTDGYLNLTTISSNSTKSIEIFDVVGKKVLSQQTVLSKIDVSQLKGGIYVIKVSAENKTCSSRLVIK